MIPQIIIGSLALQTTGSRVDSFLRFSRGTSVYGSLNAHNDDFHEGPLEVGVSEPDGEEGVEFESSDAVS